MKSHFLFGLLLLAGTSVLSATSQYQIDGWGYNSYGQASAPLGLSNVIAVAAANEYSLAVKSDGTVFAWGSEGGAQSLTNLPPGLSNVVSVAAGLQNSIALRADGSVIAWGWDTNVPSGLSGVQTVAVGDTGFYTALLRDSTVVSWSYRPSGGSVAATNVPSGVTNVQQIACGGRHTVALKTDGSVVAWGNNEFGQCSVPPGLTDVVAVSAGSASSLALRSNGTVVGWGDNSYGQTTPPPGLSNAVAITMRGGFSTALKADGTVDAWGFPALGRTQVPPTLSGVVAISQGHSHVLVLKTNAPPAKPFITAQPQSVTAITGTEVSFSVSAGGATPLTFEWLHDGNTVTGAQNSTLTLQSAQPSDAGAYYAVVQNAHGVATSAVATLTILVPPAIVLQPQNRTNKAGTTFFFEASAAGTEPLSYQWRKDGVDIPGATSHVVVLNNAQPESAGHYTMVVTNVAGSITSAPAILTVMPPAPVASGTLVSLDGPDVPPDFGEIIAVTAKIGFLVALRADGTVAAYPVLTNVPAGLSNVVAIAAGNDVEPFHYGGFALALKSDGSVAGWGFGDSPASIVPPDLSNVTAIAAGSTRAYALKSDRTVVSWGSGPGPPSLSNVIAIAASYGSGLAMRDDGTVVSWGSIGPGIFANERTLTAISLGGGFIRGQYYFYPLGLRSDGTVAGYGVPPGLADVIAVSSGGSYSLQPALPFYYALALQSDGSVAPLADAPHVARMSHVTSIEAGGGYGLVITRWPVLTAQPQSTTNQPGSAVTFTVAARGLGPFAYQWEKNGIPINGADSAILSIDDVGTSDVGDYRVVVSNDAGSITSLPATLALFGAPTITLQPRSETVFVGARVAFSAAANGAAPLSYQWRRDASDLPGENDTVLGLSAVQSGDAGAYRLVVSNAVGVAISEPANLTVTEAPHFAISPPGTVVSLDGPAVPPGLTDIVAISAGHRHALAVRSNGTVVAWGRANFEEASVPEGLSNIVAVAAGVEHSLALKRDGTVVGWGTYYAQAPADLVGIVAVAAGQSYSLALKCDGTVVSWGNFPPPPPLNDIAAIDAAFVGGLALRSDGTVAKWGLLGLNSWSTSNIVAVSGSPFLGLTILLLKNDGTVLKNDGSILGLGVVPGVSNVASIAAGNNGYGLALKDDGTVVGLGSAHPPIDLSGVSAIAAGGFGLMITTNPPPQPMLSAEKYNDSISLMSPVSVSGYVLEATDDLLVPYTAVGTYTNSFLLPGTGTLGFEAPVTAPRTFYRLRKLY